MTLYLQTCPKLIVVDPQVFYYSTSKLSYPFVSVPGIAYDFADAVDRNYTIRL